MGGMDGDVFLAREWSWGGMDGDGVKMVSEPFHAVVRSGYEMLSTNDSDSPGPCPHRRVNDSRAYPCGRSKRA